MSKDALAYYNHGRWVADCPEDGCTDARALHPEDRNGVVSPRPEFEQVCVRGHPFRLVCPPEGFRRQVERVLAEREKEPDRGWLPEGHPWGAVYGFPTGQSIEDLEKESREVASFRSAQAAAKRDAMRAALAELGVEIRPDGSFAGQIPVGE